MALEILWFIINEKLSKLNVWYYLDIISIISNDFIKLQFVLKGRAHVTFSQSEAKCPLLGCPLSWEGRCIWGI